MDRLYDVVENLLKHHKLDTVGDILNYIEIKYNIFDDLIRLINLCDGYDTENYDFEYFRERLTEKIIEQRGDEGIPLIKKIRGVKK